MDRRTAPRRRSSGPRPGPLAGIAFALAVVGIGVAGWAARHKTEAAPDTPGTTDPAPSPFADLAEEQGPRRRSPGGAPVAAPPTATEGPLADPVWLAAVELAERAYELVDEAETAKRTDDTALYTEKAVAARQLLERAIDDTVQWEISLQDQLGDEHPTVKKVVRERTRWLEQRAKYRKAGADD